MITDEETLFEEFESVQESGHAFDDEKRWRGLGCVGPPVLTDSGE